MEPFAFQSRKRQDQRKPILHLTFLIPFSNKASSLTEYRPIQNATGHRKLLQR